MLMRKLGILSMQGQNGNLKKMLYESVGCVQKNWSYEKRDPGCIALDEEFAWRGISFFLTFTFPFLK